MKDFLPEPDDDDADGVIDELFGIGASDPFEDGTPFEFESVRREEVFIGRDEAAKKSETLKTKFDAVEKMAGRNDGGRAPGGDDDDGEKRTPINAREGVTQEAAFDNMQRLLARRAERDGDAKGTKKDEDVRGGIGATPAASFEDTAAARSFEAGKEAARRLKAKKEDEAKAPTEKETDGAERKGDEDAKGPGESTGRPSPRPRPSPSLSSPRPPRNPRPRRSRRAPRRRGAWGQAEAARRALASVAAPPTPPPTPATPAPSRPPRPNRSERRSTKGSRSSDARGTPHATRGTHPPPWSTPTTSSRRR